MPRKPATTAPKPRSRSPLPTGREQHFRDSVSDPERHIEFTVVGYKPDGKPIIGKYSTRPKSPDEQFADFVRLQGCDLDPTTFRLTSSLLWGRPYNVASRDCVLSPSDLTILNHLVEVWTEICAGLQDDGHGLDVAVPVVV